MRFEVGSRQIHMRHTKRLEEGGGMQHFRDALAAVVAEEVEFPKGTLVTIVDAKVTSDTRHAKGVISVYPISSQKIVLEKLKEADRYIKEGLGERLRMRRIPNLFWACDETEEKAAEVEMLLNQIPKEEK